jgi:hypothetical protein
MKSNIEETRRSPLSSSAIPLSFDLGHAIVDDFRELAVALSQLHINAVETLPQSSPFAKALTRLT